MEDTIYAQPIDNIADFAFDEKVASVFNDMIERSVPGYRTIVNMIGILAREYCWDGSNCYDLGTSLGTVANEMHQYITGTCKIIAVDRSPAMIKRCQEQLDDSIEVVHANIQDIEITNASMVVLNFTLQFIDPEERVDVLQKIYNGMLPGGILVISEKINLECTEENKRQIYWHHNFKMANGYSALEVEQKQHALRKVMILDTLTEHRLRLEKIGFSEWSKWFQCFNFASMIAKR